VAELFRRQGRLDLDAGLRRRLVSDTSRTYPDSQFGTLPLDDEMRLGDQAALLSLSGTCGNVQKVETVNQSVAVAQWLG